MVTTKDRVIQESVSGITGIEADNKNYHFERVNRVTFYGKIRHAVSQFG